MSSSVSTQEYCSRCHKMWTLETTEGSCNWCNQPSYCQTSTQPRHIKSSQSRSRKQATVHSNGYDQLDGQWLTYYKVASRFSHKAMAIDREDLLHDIILTLATVERNNGHKPFTEAVMYRIASRTVADYWRAHYKLTTGLDCWHCSKAQRRKCHEDWLYRECPKAIKLESLNKPMLDNDGNTTELGELIADDKAIDLEAWLDCKTFLLGCPDRLIAIAEKARNGEALTSQERQYLWYWRKREQKKLNLS
jgi:DNA-directed RNA polymerase specialized sigma24 family protein